MTNPSPTRYIISAEEAQSMAKSKNLTVPQLLPSLVKSAKDLAVTPISKFPVGAVGLVSDGRIFLGGNVEFPGLPLHHTIHGEQFLITNIAAHAGGSKLEYMAVSATPCGHCRQFFQEVRGIFDTQIVITDDPEFNPDYKPFSSILPNPFGPFNLLDEHTPLVLEKHTNKLSLKYDNLIINNVTPLVRVPHAPSIEKPLKMKALAEALVTHTTESQRLETTKTAQGSLTQHNEETLKVEALEAARGSHAPYSGCPSSVALMDCEGRVYKGSYMESAAYNPSMMPVQAALVTYMVACCGGFKRIVAGVLVEKEEVVVRQEDTARLIMKHISPRCELLVVHYN